MSALWASFAVALLAAAPVERRPEPRNALERLARQTADALAERAPEPPLALYVRADAAELERGFTSLLASELAARKLAPVALRVPTPEAAEPAAREQGARSLARLTLALEHGLLQARGDLTGTWVNFWAGQVPTRPAQPAAALAQSTEADAHALALAARPPPVTAPPQPTPPEKLALTGAALGRLPLPTAALAAGDLDGDGRDEVVALTDEELVAFTFDGAVLASRDHRGLPPSPTPCREPAGSVAVYANPPRVAYFSARRARGEVLEYDKANKAFRPVGVVEQPPLGAGELVMSAPLLPGQSTFAAEVTVAGKGSVSAGGPFVALSVLPTPGGEGEAMVVYPNGGGARLDLRAASIAAEPLSGLGAGSALVDLDGDGKAEVATSSPLFAPEGDELRVLDGSGKTVLWQSPVGRGQVMQAASVELEKGKARGLVLGVWTPDGGAELRLFRRASP